MFKIMRTVFEIKIGIKPDSFCVYCCLAEFGSENRTERENCLHKCMEVNNLWYNNVRLKIQRCMFGNQKMVVFDFSLRIKLNLLALYYSMKFLKVF
jgi:hypothetical protein